MNNDKKLDFDEVLARFEAAADRYFERQQRRIDERNENIDKLLAWAQEVSKKTGIPLEDI